MKIKREVCYKEEAIVPTFVIFKLSNIKKNCFYFSKFKISLCQAEIQIAKKQILC